MNKINRRSSVRPSVHRASHVRAHHDGELLLAVSHALTATSTLVEGIAAIITMATNEFDAERCSLFFNDPETNELFFLIEHNGGFREFRIPNNSGIAGYVFKTHQAAIIHDAYADPRFNQNVDKDTGFLTRSILCVPLKSSTGEIIGVAQLLNKRSGEFDDADQSLLIKMMSVGVLALKGVHFPEKRNDQRASRAHFSEPMKVALQEG